MNPADLRKQRGNHLRRLADDYAARDGAASKPAVKWPTLDELAARYRASPVQLSERHRAAMGLAPAGTEEAAQCA